MYITSNKSTVCVYVCVSGATKARFSFLLDCNVKSLILQKLNNADKNKKKKRKEKRNEWLLIHFKDFVCIVLVHVWP